jgi:putative transposase
MKNPVLTEEQILEEVISCLERNIPLHTQGSCDQRTVFEILIRAASVTDSVENTCRILQDVPCGNDIRYHLEKYDDMTELENNLNKALQDRLPPRIYKGKQAVAVDINLIPYYGTPTPAEEPYICRSKAKAGTCSFYAYATLYVIRKGKRITAAIISVRRDDTDVAVITRLLGRISPLKLRIKRMLIDRGFFSVPVIRWLKALDIPFEMPVIIRGKTGGTRQLIRGGRSYETVYTMNSQQYGSVSFRVRVICVYSMGRYGRQGIDYFAYAVHRIGLRLRAVHEDYRKRFGIETSYRLKNTCRIRTTTKNPVVRFLFTGIAFILTDIWVRLTWEYISQPRQGGRFLYHELFPLKLMLTFLRQAVDRKHQLINAVFIDR